MESSAHNAHPLKFSRKQQHHLHPHHSNQGFPIHPYSVLHETHQLPRRHLSQGLLHRLDHEYYKMYCESYYSLYVYLSSPPLRSGMWHMRLFYLLKERHHETGCFLMPILLSFHSHHCHRTPSTKQRPLLLTLKFHISLLILIVIIIKYN